MSRLRIAVREDTSNLGAAPTTSFKVVVCGPKGGVYYTAVSTPRLASRHRLQPALKRCAEAAAKAIEGIAAELPT